jgi:4-amino-4-deoxy-L-arabinose transferase-like glycosyltransferase
VARALGRFVVRHYTLCVVLVLGVMACNVFLRLATNRIDDSDEARYGVSAFEMLRSKSLLVTTYAERPEYWNLKPPLGYWLIASSYSLFGCSALAMRLPSALFALAVVAATMRFCRIWSNRRLAIAAGLILATSFGFLSHHGARSGDLDACLTFTLLLMAIQLPRLGHSPLRVLTLGPILGCGFLLKSFAILPMVAVGAAYGVATGSWRKQKLGPCLLSLGALLVMVATWVGARSHADRSFYFVRRMVLEDLFARSTSLIDKGTSSPLAYVTGLADRFAPWPFLILAAAALTWQERRRRAAARGQDLAGSAPRRHRPWFRREGVLPLLGLWIGIPLTLFSLARTQHHWYLDPIYPACAMLAAPAILYLAGRAPRRFQGAALIAFVVLPLAVCEARVILRVIGRDRMPASQRFLYALRKHSHGRCAEVRTTFPLLHSERFILEVVDGFRVVEDPPRRWPPAGPVSGHPPTPSPVSAQLPAPSPGTCLLMAKRQLRPRWRARHGLDPAALASGWMLEKENATYALFSRSPTAGEPAAPVAGPLAESASPSSGHSALPAAQVEPDDREPG